MAELWTRVRQDLYQTEVLKNHVNNKNWISKLSNHAVRIGIAITLLDIWNHARYCLGKKSLSIDEIEQDEHGVHYHVGLTWWIISLFSLTSYAFIIYSLWPLCLTCFKFLQHGIEFLQLELFGKFGEILSWWPFVIIYQVLFGYVFTSMFKSGLDSFKKSASCMRRHDCSNSSMFKSVQNLAEFTTDDNSLWFNLILNIPWVILTIMAYYQMTAIESSWTFDENNNNNNNANGNNDNNGQNQPNLEPEPNPVIPPPSSPNPNSAAHPKPSNPQEASSEPPPPPPPNNNNCHNCNQMHQEGLVMIHEDLFEELVMIVQQLCILLQNANNMANDNDDDDDDDDD